MLAREVPWGLFHLFGGLLVLVAGAEHAGLFLPLVGAVAAAEPLGVFGLPAVVFGMAVLANVMNNLPAALHRGIRPGEPVPRCTRRGDLAAAVIVGVNLGPNLTTVGSLATTPCILAPRHREPGSRTLARRRPRECTLGGGG